LPYDSPRCPECGYQPTQFDRSNAERRSVFLELTKLSGIGISGLFAIVSLAILPWGGFSFAIGMIGPIAGQLIIGRGSAALHARLARAAWRYSVVWLLLPWVVGTLGWIGYDANYRRNWDTPPVWISLRDKGFGGVTIPLVLVTFSLAAYRLWRWSWRRACRTGAVPNGIGDSIAAKIGARCVLYPWVAIASVMFIIVGAVQLMDRLVPGWSL